MRDTGLCVVATCEGGLIHLEERDGQQPDIRRTLLQSEPYDRA